MRKDKFNVPVLLLIFNRPDITYRVFEQIRECRPSRLFIAADGPREDVPQDKGKCSQAREITRAVDWDCNVKTLFREKNLGCGIAPCTAVDWFFENVEYGIILEDDCLPHQTFFRFCEELLKYYKNDQRVMTISGSNFQFGRKPIEYSYYFSKYTFMWGWATWRRAWDYFDLNMKVWPKVRDSGLLFNILGDRKEACFWRNNFEQVFTGKKVTWDYQWQFSSWLQNGLTIVPKVNLVSNIGFGDNSTHTKGRSVLAGLEGKEIGLSLVHPPYIFPDKLADKINEKYVFNPSRLYKKIINMTFGH